MLQKILAAKLVWLVPMMIIFSSVGFTQGLSITNFTVPYTSYIFDYWENSVPAPQAYLPSQIITGDHLNVGSFSNPNDLCVTSNGNVYIADTGNNRVVVFDKNWQLIKTIATFDNQGQEDTFKGPMGIFVTELGEIYVADTGNARIVHFDSTGELVREIGEPKSSVEGVLPEGFVYRPLKVGVDKHERIYVISQDLFEGFITFSEDGQFRGFIGAPRVTPKLSDYIWSRLATKEQRERMQMFLPTEYSGFDIDPDGFIYATSTDEDKGEDEGGIPIKVRKLNPKGEDLLRRLGFSPPMGDVEFPDRWSTATRRMSSTMVDITVQDFGVYSVLDANRGRVFTYDNNGNLLYMFGYIGTDHGQVSRPVAIDHYNKTIMILDAQRNAVVTFEPTDYALLIWAALDSYNRGDYAQTEIIWEKVLALNANNDLAYTGIARTLLRREQYADAMKNFKLGNNRSEYSEAFELYRKEVIYSRFPSVVRGILIALVVGVVIRFVLKRRRKLRPAREEVATTVQDSDNIGFVRRTWDSLKFSFYVIIHPIDGFTRLKYEKRGTVPAATIILGLVVVTFVFARQYTGFIFNTVDLKKINLLVEMSSVVLPFILWCAVNWALTTLMEGKGTFRDVYIATAFALVPLILTIIPLTVMSNYITAEEGAFYYLLMSLGTAWAGVILFVGAVMTTHEYDFKKTVFTCVFTVAGMAFALFIGFLFVSLSEQVVIFVQQIVTEVLHRT